MKKIMMILALGTLIMFGACKKTENTKTPAEIQACYETYQKDLTSIENMVKHHFISDAEARNQRDRVKKKYNVCCGL